MGRRRRRRDLPDDSFMVLDAVPLPTANRRLFEPFPEPSRHFVEIEDNRAFHPLSEARPHYTVSGAATDGFRISSPSKKFKRQLPFGLSFAAPKQTLVCVRRSQRKEILHALRKTGRGSGRRKPPKRNALSSLRCR